jgi:5-methylcytosine-specific restriction endonuclease McrA
MTGIPEEVKRRSKNKAVKTDLDKIICSEVGNYESETYFMIGKVAIRRDIDKKRIHNFLDDMSTSFSKRNIYQLNDPYHYIVCKVRDNNITSNDLNRDFKSSFNRSGISTCIHHKEHSAVEHRDKRSFSAGVTVMGNGGSFQGREQVVLYCKKCNDWKYDKSILQSIIDKVKRN